MHICCKGSGLPRPHHWKGKGAHGQRKGEGHQRMEVQNSRVMVGVQSHVMRKTPIGGKHLDRQNNRRGARGAPMPRWQKDCCASTASRPGGTANVAASPCPHFDYITKGMRERTRQTSFWEEIGFTFGGTLLKEKVSYWTDHDRHHLLILFLWSILCLNHVLEFKTFET